MLSIWTASTIALPVGQYDYNYGSYGLGGGGYNTYGLGAGGYANTNYMLNNNGRPTGSTGSTASTAGYYPYNYYGANNYLNPYSAYSPYYPQTNSYTGSGGWNGLVWGSG